MFREIIAVASILFLIGAANPAFSDPATGIVATAPASEALPMGEAAEVDHGMHGPHEYSEADHTESKGLPQMDPTWYPSQVFWLFVTFVFLYTVFSKKILPDISSTLENRRNQIQEDLNFASSLKDEAEKTHAAYEALLNEAHSSSNEMFSRFEDGIKQQISEKNAAFQKSSISEIKNTEALIDEARVSAMSEMQIIAAEIASLAANKIIGVKTDINEAQTLVKNISKKAA